MWESTSEEEEEEVEGGKEEGGRSGVGSSRESGVVDVEDVGKVLHRARVPRASRELEVRKRVEPREMVTPLLRKNLSKQGTYMYVRIMYVHVQYCTCTVVHAYIVLVNMYASYPIM